MRKAIQLSESTLVVSLPAKWVKQQGLVKGSDLFVEENGSKLHISTEKDTYKTTELDFSELTPQLCWVALDAAYISGNNRITIRRGKEAVDITKMSRYFPGLIVVEDTRTHVVLESIGAEEMNYDILVARIFNITLAIITDAIEALQNKDKFFFTRIKYRDYTLNTYVSMALRYVLQENRAAPYFTYVKLLEMFADKLCVYLQKNPDKAFLKEIYKLYEGVRSLHTHYSIKKLVALNTQKKHELTGLLFEIQELEMLINETS